MTRQSLVKAKDYVARAIALCDQLGETAAAAHLQLGLDTLERTPRPFVLTTDTADRDGRKSSIPALPNRSVPE